MNWNHSTRLTCRYTGAPLTIRSSGTLRTRSIPRHYSRAPPPPSAPKSRPMLPFVVGGVGGITAVALVAYGYYHFSGAKNVVDGVRAAKDRYTNTKAAVAEKSEAARNKMSETAATAKEVARQKRTDLSERWAARFSRRDGKEGHEDE